MGILMIMIGVGILIFSIYELVLIAKQIKEEMFK